MARHTPTIVYGVSSKLHETTRGTYFMRTLNIWRIVVIGLSIMLLLSACGSSSSPEDTVDLYLSEAEQRGTEAALLLWELTEMGTESFTLDEEQQKIRMHGRRTLAIELTDAIGIAGARITWKREGTSYYNLRNGIPLVTDSRNEADFATINMRILIENRNESQIEEYLAFNLWMHPIDGWSITGLDKSLMALEPFLNSVRQSK
jgi:hypothetical protein